MLGVRRVRKVSALVYRGACDSVSDGIGSFLYFVILAMESGGGVFLAWRNG